MILSVQSDALKGAAWMLASSFCFVVSATLARYLAGSYHTFGAARGTPIAAKVRIAKSNYLAAPLSVEGQQGLRGPMAPKNHISEAVL